VVDTDPARVAELQDRFDLRGLVGNALLPSVLREAGAADADLLIAVTATDETNLVACKIAAVYSTCRRALRACATSSCREHPELTGEQGFRVSHTIWPEGSVTDMVLRLIEQPEALQVLDFATARHN